MSEKVNDKNKNIKLSVAIPTYNGARYIGDALDSIIPQLEGIDEEVEILISDNASTDQTPEIIREYQKKYTFIKYFRNDENFGFDINCDFAVKKSRGVFVWLLGDDDQICDGAISKVLLIIGSEKEIVYISLNYSYYDETLTKLLIKRAVPQNNDMLLTSPDYLDLSIIRGYISSTVVRRYNWLSIKTERYYGTDWLYFAVVLEYLPGHKFYFVASPCVRYRQVSKWAVGGQGFNTFLNLKRILSNLPTFGYQKETVDFMLSNMAVDLPKTILAVKIKGLSVSVKGFKELIKEFRPYPIQLLFSLFIYLIPKPIFHLFHRLLQNKFICKRFKSVFAKMGV